jgi:hypothetical protein
MHDTITSPPFRRRRSLWLAAVLCTALPGAALGADADADKLAQLQQKLEQSIRMIDALSARVRELESRQAAQSPAAPAARPAEPSPAMQAESERIQAVEQKVAQIETANATRRGDDTGLPLHGFADVGVANRNPYNPDLKGFNVGNLDFYLTPRLGDRTLALFELNFEVNVEGAVGVDLERAQIGYQFSDQATVWLGRFHTPYGYINTAMHHGAWISDALRRPKFVQFEDHGGSLPAHTVGAWLTGGERLGDGKLVYDLYVGNGQQIIGGVVDMRNAGNTHGSPIVGGRIGYQFGSGPAEGLTVGLHALSSRVDDDQTPIDITRVNMVGGYAVYDTDRWEHIAEFYAFSNEDLTGGTGTHRSEAGFVQLAYRGAWGIPYVRYERAAFKQADQYFLQQATGNSYYRAALGMRFDLDLKSALKFELANTHDTDRLVDQYNEALVQYAIRF